MQNAYYQAAELPLMPQSVSEYPKHAQFRPLLWTFIAVFACFVAFVTFGAVQNQVSQFLGPRAQIVRPRALNAAKLPFSFGKKEEEEAPPAKSSFFAPSKPATTSTRSRVAESNDSLENVGKITGVGAKVVTELALYLAFNTAYFVTNTYQFLTKEEQKELAKQTVDKQLPELLSLLGGTTETLGKTASAVASTEEYQDLQRSAAKAAEQLTKGLKSEGTPNPEVIEKLKQIVADDKEGVLSAERKSALAETLKKGGVKGAELSLYLFYNVFSVLKNLDKVLPTPEQTGGIEGKIEQLETSVVDLAESVKSLPSQTNQLASKVESIKDAIPTAQDLANLDPAEVSLTVRSSLASTKNALDGAIVAINNALKEDSEFRKTLGDISQKLKPLSEALAAAVSKLPLPKKPDGTVDYSQLLAESGIITVKGLKALIEATKKAAESVKAKTADNN